MNELLIILILILLNGVFSLAEIALISARRSKLQTDADQGSAAAKCALKLSAEPDRFLSTVQIGITLIGILTGIFSGSKLTAGVAEWLVALGVGEGISYGIAQTLVVILVTYLTIVFGELLPKRIGMCSAERSAVLLARPMMILARAAVPVVWLLSKTTSTLAKLLGLNEKGSKVTEEEIKNIVREGTEDGEVLPAEEDLVQRVFLMGDLKVDSLMTHRSDLVWLRTNMSAEEVRKVLLNDMYEMYPVAEDNLDNVKGVVSLKKLFHSLDRPDFDLTKLMEKPHFLYENTEVFKALEQMRQKRFSRAVVTDEYGECVGIITLRDMLEGFMGSLPEADEEEHIIPRKDGEGWFVNGQCPMMDFLNYFEVEELYEDEDYTTVAGLCLHSLGHIPECGERFYWNMFEFEVVDMDGARVDKLIVKRQLENNSEDREDF